MQSKWLIHLQDEYGVLFHKNGTFSRFLRPGRHIIFPIFESLEFRVHAGKQNTQGATQALRLRDGTLIDVLWSVDFTINPFSTEPFNFNSANIRQLQQPGRIIEKQMGKGLRTLIGYQKLQDLNIIGVKKNLEKKLSATLTNDTRSFGFGKILPSDVEIIKFKYPDSIQKVFEGNVGKEQWYSGLKEREKRFFESQVLSIEAQIANLPKELAGLVRLIDKTHNEAEVKMLCFELGVLYENLLTRSLSKQEKILALVVLMWETGRIKELKEAIKKLRPDLTPEIDSLDLY